MENLVDLADVEGVEGIAPAAPVPIVDLYSQIDSNSSSIDACAEALHCCSDTDILQSTLYATAGMPIDHHDPIFPEAYAAAITARTVGVAKGKGTHERLQYAKFAGVKQTFQPVYNSKMIVLRRDRALYGDYLQRLQCSMFDDHCSPPTPVSETAAVYTAPGVQQVNRELIPYLRRIVRAAADSGKLKPYQPHMATGKYLPQLQGQGLHRDHVSGPTPPSHLLTLASAHPHLLECICQYQGSFPRISYQDPVHGEIGPALAIVSSNTNTGANNSAVAGWSHAAALAAPYTAPAASTSTTNTNDLEVEDEIMDY